MEEEVLIDSGLARPGSTLYRKAPALRRGMRMPARIKAIIAGLGLFAFVIAAFFGLKTYDAIANAPARYEESIAQVIATGPGLELPVLNSYVDSDNDAIRKSFADAGFSMIDVDELYANDEEIDENSLDLVKIPRTMEFNHAQELFQKSLRRAPVLEAVEYLSGSWRFTSYRAEGVDLKVKYADLNSAGLDTSIHNAIAAQGWSDSTMGDFGVDQSGNTYQSGTIQINDVTYNWTVSVCPLDEVYNVSGIPDNSYYVGARLVS